MVSDDGRSAGAGIQQMAGETLKQAGLAGIDAEMMQLHLCLGPGQRRRALERGGVAMLVHQIQHLFARFGDHGPEGDAHGRAGATRTR